MPVPEVTAAAPATPSGGAPSGGSSGSAPSGGSGGAQNLPSGGSGASKAPNGASAKPANGNAAEPKGSTFEGGSIVDRLRRAAEGETKREPRIIKHKLETGDEVDVDISEHIAEALAAARVRKLKVNGKERDVDLEEAFEKFPLSVGAHEKFEEAAQVRKQMETQREQLTNLGKQMRDVEGGGLRALLENPKMLGPQKLLAFAESIVMEALQIEKMTPEQRAQMQKQRDIEAMARKRDEENTQLKAQIERDRKAKEDAEAKRWTEHYTQAIPKLLEAAGVPHTPKSQKAWVDAKREALRLGIPATDEMIAKEVAREYFADLETLAQKLPPEHLARILGENAGKVGQAAADAHNAPGSKVSVKGREQKPSNGEMPAWVKSHDDYREWQSRLKRGQQTRTK